MKTEQTKRLVKFKEESGWTTLKIANLLGIHPQTLVYWLSGKYSPSKHVKPKVEEFLDTYSYNRTKTHRP